MELRANKEELSRTPSVLILQALEDFRGCVKDPRYVIDMCIYHKPKWSRKPRRFIVCRVCLAGSSLAKRYNTSPRDQAFPHRCDGGRRDILIAIDHFRNGYVHCGLESLDIPVQPGVPYRCHVTDYKFNKWHFHRDMKRLAAILRSHGL